MLLDNEKMMPSKQNAIEVGDHVYYYLAWNTPHLSAKISLKWIGPLQATRKVSDALFIVKPIGTWCKRARELCKVDKDQNYEGIPLSKQRQMTLPSLLKNFTILNIEYSFCMENCMNLSTFYDPSKLVMKNVYKSIKHLCMIEKMGNNLWSIQIDL